VAVERRRRKMPDRRTTSLTPDPPLSTAVAAFTSLLTSRPSPARPTSSWRSARPRLATVETPSVHGAMFATPW